eukprot:c32805_g1_i1.p1 GENE.c32805_g1_i1~~c32805_g1_i1.p1  ORF type:complete len:155 (+),score=38.26 c32805_g1_i1:48-512(+)
MGSAEAAAVGVTIAVVAIILALFKYFMSSRNPRRLLKMEEIGLKNKFTSKRKRKRRVKREFEDQKLLEDYDDIALDEAVLDSFDVDIDDAELDELDEIVASHNAARKNNPSTTVNVVRKRNEPRPQPTRAREISVDQQLDDFDDDLEAQLTGKD